MNQMLYGFDYAFDERDSDENLNVRSYIRSIKPAGKKVITLNASVDNSSIGQQKELNDFIYRTFHINH